MERYEFDGTPLIDFVPPTVKSPQFDILMEVEEKMFREFEQHGADVINNRFVDTANFDGLKRIASMYGFPITKNTTEQQLRSALKSTLEYGTVPYSFRMLNIYLNLVVGENGQIEMDVDYLNSFLRINIAVEDEQMYDKIKQLVITFIPASMTLELTPYLIRHSQIAENTHDFYRTDKKYDDVEGGWTHLNMRGANHEVLPLLPVVTPTQMDYTLNSNDAPIFIVNKKLGKFNSVYYGATELHEGEHYTASGSMYMFRRSWLNTFTAGTVVNLIFKFTTYEGDPYDITANIDII